MNPMRCNNYCWPYDARLVSRARELRKNMTQAEKLLWHNCLKSLPVRILRQRPIGHYILDFYCAKYKIAIEVDGENHTEKKNQFKDKIRDAYLKQLSIRVIRVKNLDVMFDLPMVCDLIKRELK